MLTIKQELYDFEDLKQECWSGALDRIQEIDQNGWGDEFFDYLEQYIDENMTMTDLNDAIWFELGDEFIEMKRVEEALCD